MLSKIVLTILVIMAAFFFLKMREPTVSARQRPQPSPPSEGQKVFRQAAYVFLVFMVISALLVFYFEIGDRYKTVNVHVVNTQTGERVSYRAEQQDIKSDQFTTLEGRTVYVADIERIEIEEDQ